MRISKATKLVPSGTAPVAGALVTGALVKFLKRRFALAAAERAAKSDPLLAEIRSEAKELQKATKSLRIALGGLLVQPSFERILARRLAVMLHTSTMPYTEWFPVLAEALDSGSYEGTPVGELCRYDLSVIKDRDPAYAGPLSSMMCFKGYLAIQAHRAAHVLWYSPVPTNSKKALALIIQSQASIVFAVDIHPCAKLGRGFMIDHGTGVVIGETAVLGPDCTMLHGVTLGATGKDSGDRHPKIGEGVLIGAGASILGNIQIGDRCKIGAASVVLKPIPEGATAIGCPAKVVGRSTETKPGADYDTSLKKVTMLRAESASDLQKFDSIWPDAMFKKCPQKCKEQNRMCLKMVAAKIEEKTGRPPTEEQVNSCFWRLDSECRGTVCADKFMEWLNSETVRKYGFMPSKSLDSKDARLMQELNEVMKSKEVAAAKAALTAASEAVAVKCLHQAGAGSAGKSEQAQAPSPSLL